MKTKLVFSEIGTLSFENSILSIRFADGLELNEESFRFIFEQGEKLAQGKRYCIFADVRPHVVSTPEGRKYAAKNSFSEQHLAYGVIAQSTPVILLVNFFININRPEVPTKLFKKEEDAMNWLGTFL